MIFKTFYCNRTGQYAQYVGDGEFGTCTIPKLMHNVSDIEIWNYVLAESGFSKLELEEKKVMYSLVLVDVILK